MSETRKLAAILAADVVGYSRLMGEDEAGTARAVTEHREAARPIIASLGGRIVKTMGDGFLAEFPSVVSAVESAIAIQKLMVERNAGVPEEKRIVYRIGVNLGDVLVDGDDILGEGVNIAARLESICEPGGLLLSSSAYDQVRGKIDANFVDVGERDLKNIARPVRAYALQVGEPIALHPAAQAPATPMTVAPMPPSLKDAARAARRAEKASDPLRSFRRTAIVLFLIAAAGWRFVASHPIIWGANPPPAPAASTVPASTQAAHLSIVVLPFTNLSGDPAQDYLADGVTENLTTDLSRIRNSFVIARNTAFTYKGKSVDAKEIGKELGVRYVLEGSVQRDGTRVRVNAQLVDAESGAHLWADRFEEDVADLFKLQDEVVARLGNALGFELIKAEAAKSARSNNPDAIDLAMRGWATMYQSYPQPPKEKRDSHYTALALFDRALKADPNDADALAGEAFTYMALFAFAEATAETDFNAKIVDQADRAIALAPDNMQAYYAKSVYLTGVHRANEAARVADAGLAINPNSAPLLDARSLAQTALGRFEQAKSDALQAMRLSPRDPEIPNRLINLGMAELGLGHFDAAVVEFQKAIDAGAHYFIPYVTLAAAYALEGKTDEAQTALAEARRLNPQLTVTWLTAHAPDVPPLFEGLRKAGLPQQ